MNTPGLAFRHLRSRPLRSVLTTAAIALSVGLVGFLLLLNDALQKDWSDMQAQRAIVVAKTSFFERLPLAYLARIEDVPGVRRVCPFDFLLGFQKDNRPENQIPIGGAPADALIDVYVEMKLSKDEIDEWKKDPRGSVVGPILADKFGWKVGTHVVLKAPVEGGVIDTTIRAVMRYKLDNGLYIHRKYLEGLMGDKGLTGMFWVLAQSRDDLRRITAEIDRRLENAPVPIRAMTEKQWQVSFMQMLGNVKALIGSIGIATAFTLLLITSNTLAMAARERKGETALLRILGFSRARIFLLMLMEGAIYGVIGALFGLGVMVLFGRVIGSALDKTAYAGLGELLRPDLESALLIFAVSSCLAMGAAVIPALNLSRRSIVQLLRDSS